MGGLTFGRRFEASAGGLLALGYRLEVGAYWVRSYPNPTDPMAGGHEAVDVEI